MQSIDLSLKCKYCGHRPYFDESHICAPNSVNYPYHIYRTSKQQDEDYIEARNKFWTNEAKRLGNIESN
jgi:hypothetical protein